jgi:hypothetical protein
MGLDIYFHKTKHALNGDDYSKVMELTEQDSKARLNELYDQAVADLKQAEGTDGYTEKSLHWLREIAKITSYPSFDLGGIGYETEWVDNNDGSGWRHEEQRLKAVPLETWLSQREEIVKVHYDKEVLYYRKVNFLFSYFANKGTMIDEAFSMVTKEDVLDIINKCKFILKNHDLADELLPTQSGFFFGSTDYDRYYYHDVECVLKQFEEELLPLFDEDWNVYVYFSW